MRLKGLFGRIKFGRATSMKSPHPLSVPMKFYLLCTLSFAASFVGAATFSLAPVGDSQPASAQAASAAADANVVKVTGRGVGTDRAAALKDAYRDAVERAVGLYVDAEQMAKNDEIVSDQILTQSNAYIEKCDIVKESTANGLVTVKVLALVRKQELTKRMTDVMPPNTVNLGRELGDLHAQMVTKEKRGVDGKALIENVLKDVNPFRQLYTVDIVSPKPLLGESKTAGMVWVSYLFRIQIDREKYLSSFLPPLQKVLGQISSVPPRTVRLNRLSPQGSFKLDDEDARTEYLQGKRGMQFNAMESAYGGVFGESVWLAGDLDFFGQSRCPVVVKRPGLSSASINRAVQECFNHPSGHEYKYAETLKQGVSVRVVDRLNDSLSACKATDYVVDANVAESILTWERGLGVDDREAKFKFTVVFLTGDKEEVGAFTRSVPHRSVTSMGFLRCEIRDIVVLAGRRDGMKRQYLWYVSPFIGGSASCFYVWKSFELPKDDLPKVSAMSIEVAE